MVVIEVDFPRWSFITSLQRVGFFFLLMSATTLAAVAQTQVPAGNETRAERVKAKRRRKLFERVEIYQSVNYLVSTYRGQWLFCYLRRGSIKYTGQHDHHFPTLSLGHHPIYRINPIFLPMYVGPTLLTNVEIYILQNLLKQLMIIDIFLKSIGSTRPRKDKHIRHRDPCRKNFGSEKKFQNFLSSTWSRSTTPLATPRTTSATAPATASSTATQKVRAQFLISFLPRSETRPQGWR
jgi:hypothetical protein